MKKALVIIDMQYAFINDNTKHLIDKIKRYAKENDFNAVVCTAYINNRDTACYKFEGWKKCMSLDAEAKVVSELESISLKTFKKSRYSCWTEEFKTWVKDNNIDKLYFVGVNTACCVLHSVLDAYNDVQDCCVVGDLCGSTTSIESHERGLEVLRECITKERVIESGLR